MFSINGQGFQVFCLRRECTLSIVIVVCCAFPWQVAAVEEEAVFDEGESASAVSFGKGKAGVLPRGRWLVATSGSGIGNTHLAILSAWVLAKLSNRRFLVDHLAMQRAYVGAAFEPWQRSLSMAEVRRLKNGTRIDLRHTTLLRSRSGTHSDEVQWLLHTNLKEDPRAVLCVSSNQFFLPLLFLNPFHFAQLERIVDNLQLRSKSPMFARGKRATEMTKEIARALFRPSAELSHMMAYNLRNLSGVCSVGLHVRIVSNGFTEIKGKLNGLIQKAERCVRPGLVTALESAK